MLRLFTFLVMFGTSFSAAIAGLISEDDLVGTWKIEASTFEIRERATPNSFPRPQLPTNYNTFALSLRKDGTFLLTNAPPGFFLVSGNGSGKWSARTNWPFRFAPDLPKDPKYAYSELNLVFDSPKVGAVQSYIAWSAPIYQQAEGKLKREPSLSFGPFKDTTQTYEWE